MRIVCLSDTHGHHADLDVPDGDLFVHAGDFTRRGRPEEVRAFGRFLAALPHRHKVVVAGNHDFLFQDEPERARELLGDVTYLEDSGVTIEGLEVWGSPWQPWFHDWAFNLPRGGPIAEKWALVPESTHVLVTHGPPHGTLDRTWLRKRVGCEELTRALARIRPRLHVFGHIHEDHGHLESNGTLFVNACNCDRGYRAVQAPQVVEWSGDGPRMLERA